MLYLSLEDLAHRRSVSLFIFDGTMFNLQDGTVRYYLPLYERYVFFQT